ncbi:Calx-beta domain-containing protein [Carboxylicivirga sp. RSCT41]|uniref:Calx-beta domain-containing protein n=1 Tax=Carboxylicivirga agarovorans TaxID=3417570 RepID=UPI003D32BBE8
MEKLIMNTYIKIVAFIGLLIGLAACESNDVNLFNDKDAFFAFEEENLSISENTSEDLEISLYMSSSDPVGDLQVETDTEGITNPAIEGVDYILKSGKTVTFNGECYENVVVELINNDVRDGKKQFYIVMKSASVPASLGMAEGKKSRILVNITDDEHPLAALFGELNVFERTIEPKEFNYEVNISGHEDADKAVLTGLWDVPQPLILQFNYETNEVIILPNQVFTSVDVGIPLDFTIKGWNWAPDGSNRLQLHAEVIGTFDIEKGEIEFPNGYLLQCSGPEESQYIGGIWAWTVQDYCKMTKN